MYTTLPGAALNPDKVARNGPLADPHSQSMTVSMHSVHSL